MCMLFFCFKQKTAYEMRISDWSSDVCSSDLPAVAAFRALGANIVPVGLDEDGIDVEAVEHACRRNAVRAVFVTPHHQFPTTVSLRPERRSEEHTSELQSLMRNSYAVFCLKKKTQKITLTIITKTPHTR